MTEQELAAQAKKADIKRKNELIAEFMGYKYYCWNDPARKSIDYTSGYWGKKDAKTHGLKLHGTMMFNPLNYHTSWDWLMPVIKKCGDISQGQDRPSKNHCNKLDWLESDIHTHLRDCNIEEVFPEVIKFIVHYNSTEQNSKLCQQ